MKKNHIRFLISKNCVLYTSSGKNGTEGNQEEKREKRIIGISIQKVAAAKN